MQPNNPSNLDLKFIVPTVSYDGIVVNINKVGIPTLAFFQARKSDPNNVEADVVASVRLNNLNDLKEIQRIIQETIDSSQNAEA